MPASISANSMALAKSYLNQLLNGERGRAIETILNQVRQGLPVSTVYLDVLQPVMYEVGRLWQTDEISIAVEHYCTAATQLLMAQLYPIALTSRRINRSMIGCCLGNELHELGMRMVCDLFEFEGWDTFFLGAITPSATLNNTILEKRPDLLCLSATMAFGIPQTRNVIVELRDALGKDAPKIMVGGLAFLIKPSLAESVGADATAADAREAVRTAAMLFLPQNGET